jgi:hypothetical protein
MTSALWSVSVLRFGDAPLPWARNIGAMACNGKATIVSPFVEAPEGAGFSQARTLFHGISILPCFRPFPSSESGK